VIDAGGAALLPGLHDHHIHLLALAAARRSVPCGPPEVTSVAALATALRAAAQTRPAGEWVRGVGYHESVAGDLDRYTLDALVADHPVRVQHRSGHGWVFNTAALKAAAVGEDAPEGTEFDGRGQPTGRLWGLDSWLRARMPGGSIDLAAIGAELAAFGITGVTDATPFETAADVAPLDAAVADGALGVHVTITGAPDLARPAGPSLRRGPVKLVVADHGLPSFDSLRAGFTAARRAGRAVAVHAVTREALVLALAVWHDVGSVHGDRVEHGAVIPVELIADLAELGLAVVTQPSLVARRGDDYRRDVEADDRPHLWRCGSLLTEGIGIGFSSDAPFGDPDPWFTIAAAVQRSTPSGALLGAAERVSAQTALERLLSPLDDPGGRPRRIATGVPADLCLLDVPLAEALRSPDARHVRTTIAGGAIRFDR
jgi:predicted amidohydrolase YtcJ